MTPPLSLDAFAPWLAQLNHNHRKWFAHVFELILENNFTLVNSLLQTPLNEGRCLYFVNPYDCHIDVTRQLPTNEYGNRPGLILMNEALDRELTFTVNTPTEVIRLAIETLANEE